MPCCNSRRTEGAVQRQRWCDTVSTRCSIDSMHIDPTRTQAQSFATTADRAEPVFMLNLLRFKEGTGAESYARYSAAAREHLARVGGAIVWAGACDEALIGPEAASGMPRPSCATR